MESLQWDKYPNRLIPTIIQSEHDGKILGHVYSSEKSLAVSLEKERVILQSRRQPLGQLWEKSPSRLRSCRLRRVLTDCDSDALIFVVQERGDFCHEPGQRSCFSSTPLWESRQNP